MGKGFAKKKKQARMMQDQLTKMQEQMEKAEVTGSAGNGLVTIVLSGQHEMKSIKIKPDCVDPEDIEGLEDLVKAAYKDAMDKLSESNDETMPGMPQIPGMPDLGSFGF